MRCQAVPVRPVEGANVLLPGQRARLGLIASAGLAVPNGPGNASMFDVARHPLSVTLCEHRPGKRLNRFSIESSALSLIVCCP